MPIFALANAGVSLAGGELDSASWHVLVAVAAGLIIGKPLGVLIASWLSLRSGIATLPAGLTYRHLVVLGIVAGVGFTMALFVAQLAFTGADLLAAAKLGVLAASGGAAVAGLLLGWVLLVEATGRDVARTADEAESSTVA
jgi:NhaA family Na+:H+ antiporter